MQVEISNGELLDKLSILEIKKELIHDPEKLNNIIIEFNILSKLAEQLVTGQVIETLFQELLTVNLKLWKIEDEIRNKEFYKEFDDDFIALARSVYFTNDERSEIKRKINNLTQSLLTEEKSYVDYKKS